MSRFSIAFHVKSRPSIATRQSGSMLRPCLDHGKCDFSCNRGGGVNAAMRFCLQEWREWRDKSLRFFAGIVLERTLTNVELLLESVGTFIQIHCFCIRKVLMSRQLQLK